MMLGANGVQKAIEQQKELQQRIQQQQEETPSAPATPPVNR
jgi:hypothetical protein